MADLSLFDNITVNNHDRISKSDRERIDSLTESFHRTLANLYDWRDIFTERLKNAPDTVVIRYNKVEDRSVTRYMSESTPEERMSALAFHPLYGLENVCKLAVRAALAYERQIVDHFRTTYNGDFEPKGVIRDSLFGDIFENKDSGELSRNKITFDKLPELPQERRFPDATPVIDHIIESLGGLSFKQKADKLTLERFTAHFKYGKPGIKGGVITLGGFVYRGWFYDRDEINYETVNKVNNMLETVMVCEDSDFKPAVTYDRDHIIWGNAYEVRHSGLLSSIAFFKNGNLKMKFNSAVAAQRFYTFCFGPIQTENEK